MVGVAQHHLCADVLQILCRQAALDGACRSNVLESGCLHRAVHGLELTPPGIEFLLEELVSRQ